MCICALAPTLAAADVDPSELNFDPDKARVVVDDLHRFWKAWDKAASAPDEDRRGIFQQIYFDAASPGLRSFIELRIGDVDRLLSAIDAAPEYYSSLREQTESVANLEALLQDAYRRMQAIFPGAVFPDTYIVMGALTSGGTIDRSGILIGFEMNARGPESPVHELSDWHQRVIGTVEALPVLIVHELVHIQQAVYGRLDFRDLLGQSIVEGAADFIAELALGSHPSTGIHAWAASRESDLWAEFREVMHDTETAGWLYGGSNETDRPADVGYFIGYRIVEAYYRKAEDPSAALREIIEMTNPAEFLQRSGYTGGTPESASD
ncbi:MAG: hypothetical protein JJU00_13625 [Opitutales bacterium]|nr:hypothetical protein [Opitutales bacterium]